MLTEQNVKRQIASVLCHPLIGVCVSRLFRDRFQRSGITIRTNNEYVDARTKASVFWGFYESAEIRLLRKYLLPDLDTIELGSSIGVVTSYILKGLNSDRTIIAVEANPRLLSLLEANVALNSSGHEVIFLNQAIDYGADGSGTRFRIASRSVASGVATDDDRSATVLSVPSVSLREIALTHGLSEFQLIADIEGAEVGMVMSEDPALSSRCRRIIIELHESRWAGRDVTPDDIVTRLVGELGFQLIDRIGNVCVFDRD